MTSMLIIGDTHIPDRADKVPDKLLSIIENGVPWDTVVFTGDFTSREIYEWVLRLGKLVHVVSGNMDYLPLPETTVFTLNNIEIGVHHGDGVFPRGDARGLSRIASSLGVKLLFTGHTHSFFIKRGVVEDILIVNPGSLTGVWGGGGGSLKPSMLVINVVNSVFKYILYELSSGELLIRESRFYYRENKWFVE